MQRSTPLGDANDAFEHLGIDNLSESLVNGIWNHVLSQLFPFPDFLILPEHWTDSRRPGGSRVDLVVYRMRDMGPVFVYEGKGDVEDLSLKEPSQALDVIISAGLQKNLAQIQRYLRTLRRSQGMCGAYTAHLIAAALHGLLTWNFRRILVRRFGSGNAVHHHEVRRRTILAGERD